MSVSGPQIHSGQLWAKREAKCLSVIERALHLLREGEKLPDAEVELNRRLYFCLLRASRELYSDDELAPLTECNSQPDPDDEARAKREQKRPDFQWVYLDRYESDPEHSSKQFVVECKRLGRALRAGWVLNRNYANHGVMRFREPEWVYAKRAPTGVMVGYWQSMEGNDVLREVNETCVAQSFPALVLDGTWVPGDVTRLQHVFVRAFPVSPFMLRHLWIDLRL